MMREGQAILLRCLCSVLSAAVGYFAALACMANLSVRPYGDYRAGLTGPYAPWVPVGAGLRGLALPWLLWTREKPT